MRKFISVFLAAAIIFIFILNLNVFVGSVSAASVIPNWDTDPNVVVKELPVTDVTRWNPNSSGIMDITYDTLENAVRFHVNFSPSTTGWVYPEFALYIPSESMIGAIGVSFDIKADSIINGFDYSYLMVHGTGLDQYLPYTPPTTSWQKAYVEFAGFNPAGTLLLRLGVNVRQGDFVYKVRNLKVYYSAFTLYTDQPGNAFAEPLATVFKLKYPIVNQQWDWQVVDWLGQTSLSGRWKVLNDFTLPNLPLGYYRLQVRKVGDLTWKNTIPFARVMDPANRTVDPNSPFNMDSAQSAVVPAYPSDNPLQPPDTYAVVSDLEKLAGLSMIRDRISWGEVNPQPNVFNWGKYATNAQLLAARGIKILDVFNDAPAWAREGQQSMPSNLSALYQFTKAAANQFQATTPAWEFWNEQDNGFWLDTPWDFTAAQKVAYLGYKAGYPQVNVLLGSTSLHPVTKYNSFMEVVLNNGTGDYFDTYNFHNYEPVDTFQTIMNDEHDFLQRHSVNNKPIWITESGLFYEGAGGKAPIVGGQLEHSDVQERDQAEYMVKEQITAQSLGIQRNFSFVLPPYNEGGGNKVWGSLSHDYLVKPAYSAVSNLTAQLGNLRYLGKYATISGIEGFLYEDKVSYVKTLVMWNKVDTVTTVTISNSVPQVTTVDFMGKTGTLTPTAGNFSIPVTKYPVYVRGFTNLVPTSPVIVHGSTSSNANLDSTTILRIKLGTNFNLFGKAAAILTNGTQGTATLDIYNFSDLSRQGQIENLGSGYAIDGLPSSITIPSMAKVSIPVTIRIIDDKDGINLKIGGTFNSKPISQVYVPLANVNLDKNPNLIARELPVANATRWVANSGGTMDITYDAVENAVRFHTVFLSSSGNWVYPEFPLKLPGESMAGSVGVSFDIKADSVLNGFDCSYLMAATENIHETGEADLFDYLPMTTSWQKVFIKFEGFAPAGFDPAAIKMLRLGANPNQSDFAYSVRNFKVYYPIDVVPQSNMIATATSYQSGNEPSKAIDGDKGTLWHSAWDPYVALPQSIILNLGNTYRVNGINYLPRQDGTNHGIVTQYNVYTSTNGTNFTKVVSNGVWADDAIEKAARFADVNASYVKLEAVVGDGGFASAAEINVSLK